MSDESADGADADESGYRRDDYWREEAREGTAPGEVPEPAQGYAFESPEEQAKSGDDSPAGSGQEDDAGPAPGAEQGNAGGEDDARLVED